MAKAPAFQWYAKDWMEDDGLQACSLQARGFLAQFLSVAHLSKEPGVLVLPNGKPPAEPVQAARLLKVLPKEFERCAAELLEMEALRRDTLGRLYSARMVKDAAKRAACGEAGRRGGGNPKLHRRDAEHAEKVKGGYGGTANPKARAERREPLKLPIKVAEEAAGYGPLGAPIKVVPKVEGEAEVGAADIGPAKRKAPPAVAVAVVVKDLNVKDGTAAAAPPSGTFKPGTATAEACTTETTEHTENGDGGAGGTSTATATADGSLPLGAGALAAGFVERAVFAAVLNGWGVGEANGKRLVKWAAGLGLRDPEAFWRVLAFVRVGQGQGKAVADLVGWVVHAWEAGYLPPDAEVRFSRQAWTWQERALEKPEVRAQVAELVAGIG